LLSTDGTAAGTVVEFGGLSGTQSSVIGRLPDGRVVFFQRPATAYELWVTDGTGGGTTTIATGLATPQQALSGPGGVFYRSSAQMFFTDGTVAGTQTLASLGETRLLGVLGGFAFLRASDGVHGAELWRTDGTAAGTALFADLSPGPSSSSPFNGMVADGKLFFSARDPLLGNEPWVSDGTVAGTIMIADLNPGADDSGPQGFAAIGSRVLFNAFSPASGSELWISDGTPAGTSVLWDISPGPPSSSPASIVVGNDYVFLDAVHPTAGREEHSYPLTATGAAYTDSYGLGGLGSAGRPTTYADVLPHLGGTVQLGLRQVLTGSLAIAAWSFAASPVPLAPDCFQYVSPAALTIVVANSLGEASSSIAIPNVSVYVGVQVHGQYAVLDPLGCFLDAITPSDRRRFLVGH
jgi:ELWxxDGT repeat protein